MALLCAISGNVPEAPVVSLKSGHVFEKSLITKYVAETGKDPISGQELSADELLPLNTSKTIKPRSSTATSIPGLLGLFHDEWDALMLEHHTLRQNLHTVRRAPRAARWLPCVARPTCHCRGAAARTHARALPAAPGSARARARARRHRP
jgi:hypothetical protein